MATAAPEDHEDIYELQANLRHVLADWDSAGSADRDEVFARLVPATGDLVTAQQDRLRERAEEKAGRLRDWGGRILLVIAVLLVGTLLLLGANPWWALSGAPLAAAGIYLLLAGRTSG
jgi:hypothetical protein